MTREYLLTSIFIIIFALVSAAPGLENQRLIKRSLPQNQHKIIYSLGSRIEGDRHVAHVNKNYTYPAPQDVKLTLNYPTSTPSSDVVLTYMEIIVNQSSNFGNANVLSGGIGQKEITLSIEGRAVSFFEYTADIYGY